MADNNTLTPEQMAARIAELEGRLVKNSTLSFKVSEKGAVSVYGLGRFPVTLYFEQWNKLLAHLAAQSGRPPLVDPNLIPPKPRSAFKSLTPGCLTQRGDLAC